MNNSLTLKEEPGQQISVYDLKMIASGSIKLKARSVKKALPKDPHFSFEKIQSVLEQLRYGSL